MVFSLFRPKAPEVEFVLASTTTVKTAPPPCTSLSHTHMERVDMAFQDIPLNTREAKAIRALLDHPGETAIQLSQACGWLDAAWRTQMLLLCQRRRAYLWPDGIADDATIGIIITALADYDSAKLTFCPRTDLLPLLTQAVDAQI